MKILTSGILVLVLLCSTYVCAEPFFESEYIFDPQKQSHGHVHASCIVECPNGDLLAVWYENGEPRDDYYYTRDADKSDDVRIGASRKSNGRTEWEETFVMSDTFGVSDNNPCMVIDREERLWLFHPAMLGAPIETWGSGLLCYKVSSDYQKSGPPRWDRESFLVIHPNGFDEVVARLANELRRDADWDNSKGKMAREMLEQLNNPFSRRLGWMPRAHPLVLPDGTLLVPLSNENFSVPAMAMTKDGGATWTISKAVPGGEITQPSVVRFKSGKLAAFFRDGSDDHRIKRSESDDNGMTWSPVESTSLPNPGAGIEAIMLKSGRLAMVYNDKEDGPRDILAISISEDEGRTWPVKKNIENIPNGRFDYPSIIQAKDGSLHVTYSYNLKTVKHVRFNEEWISAP